MAQTREGAIKIRAVALGITVIEYKAHLAAGLKWCWKCKTWRPRAEFWSDKSRGDGLDAICFTHRLRPLPHKTRKGLPSTFKGRKHTEEAKRKIGAAARSRPSNRTGVRHTPETRAKIRKITRERACRGDKHYNWQGGIQSEHRRIRKSPEYIDWRDAVYKRDEYTCVQCGDSRGGNLTAHHKKWFAFHPDLRFVVANGETLCEECHEILHQVSGCECGKGHSGKPS